MPKIRRTNSFLKDYRGLPPRIQAQVEKQLRLLLDDPRHHSLRLKKLKGTDNYEIRITRAYRMTLRIQEGVLELRRIGTHDLLRHEA